MVNSVNNKVWSALESSLVPPSASTTWYYSTLLKKSVEVVCLLPLGIVTGTFAGVGKVGSFAFSFFKSSPVVDPRKDFQAVVNDSRLWDKIGTVQQIEQDLINNPNGLQWGIKGVGTSTFQDSPNEVPDSQWTPDGYQQRIPKAHRPGPHMNLFKLYKTSEGRRELIDRLQKLHVTHYRFSVEWSHLQPKEGAWNQDNMQVYVDLCKDLRDAGIDPIVVLLHFSEPKWFHAKGSFENEKNITYFANFSSQVFDQLTEDYQGRPLVERFCTINEPAVDPFMRYVLGKFSPTGNFFKNFWNGRILNFAKAGIFLKNLLKAHGVVYKELKRKKPTVQVGIIHQYLNMQPTNSLLIPAVRYFTRLVNEVPMNFFRSGGKFDLKVPFLCNIEEQCAAPKTDFVGTQYYALPVIGSTGPTSNGAPWTKMPFPEAPEGIYEAIVETHKAFGVPVLVTETGISTDDDQQRSRVMLRTLYAIREAIKAIGVSNVLGISWWCFVKNSELEQGTAQDFGLYAAQTEKGLPAEPKPGVQAWIRIAQAWEKRARAKEQKTA